MIHNTTQLSLFFTCFERTVVFHSFLKTMNNKPNNDIEHNMGFKFQIWSSDGQLEPQKKLAPIQTESKLVIIKPRSVV